MQECMDNGLRGDPVTLLITEEMDPALMKKLNKILGKSNIHEISIDDLEKLKLELKGESLTQIMKSLEKPDVHHVEVGDYKTLKEQKRRWRRENFMS